MKKKVKLISIQRGVSSKTGNPYCRVSVRSKKEDGTTVLGEFWVDEKVSGLIISQGIEEDDEVLVSMALNDNLKAEICSIEKADEIDASAIFDDVAR